MPAEWEPHEACWLAWPYLEKEWGPDLEGAQREWLGLCRAIAQGGERLEILVPDDTSQARIADALGGLSHRFHAIPYGDSWMRDTAPIFLVDGGELASVRFRFNGWGGKYLMGADPDVAERIAAIAPARRFVAEWVAEGGALEVDGEGTCITTRDCLLDPHRNPDLNRRAIEQLLRDSLDVEQILWIDRGLFNDHTDGHVDTLARFVSPGVVVCMEARDASDPNREVLEEVATRLTKSRSATGRPLEVVRIPSPGAVLNGRGELLPASYCNFYVSNRTVIVPTYGSRWDDEAVTRIGSFFSDRATVGLPASQLLTGGGAFHCVTQQQPRVVGANGAVAHSREER